MKTQTERLLDYLKQHGSITKVEAWTELGIWNSGGRIFDLKRPPYYCNIRTDMINVRNRFKENCRVGRYVLDRELEQEELALRA